MATTNSNNRTTAAADFYLTRLLNLHKIEVSFGSRRPPTVLVCLSQEGTYYREPLSLEDFQARVPSAFRGCWQTQQRFCFQTAGLLVARAKWT